MTADSVSELHEIAAKFTISKSWFALEPTPHYEVISAHKWEEVNKYIEKNRK